MELLQASAHSLSKRTKQSAKVGPMSCDGLWKRVREYPGRQVSVHTAIRRIDDGESIEKACKTPPKKNSGRQKRAYQNNPAFKRDLAGSLSAKVVAKRWGVSESCIFKRRQKLKQATEQASHAAGANA
ncbi:hypothetical protein [Halomonas casei]|uniref:hypothetical protein n=1 Tax=Halomonas casei TaxID=2742613 RepID=UPI003CE6A223